VLSIFREMGTVRLDFAYSPERVRLVKAIKGARFEPTGKGWNIPLESLSTVLGRGEFPTQQVINTLGSLETVPLDPVTAFERLKTDPFSVEEEVIAALPLELVVRCNPEKRRLRLLPRLGTKTYRIVKRTAGALYSSFDGAFTLPTEKLPALLKKLRDEQLLFAVDCVAGSALSGSSGLRRSITEEPERWTADDFGLALLTPFITEVISEPGTYRPCYFTAEQFKLAFANANKRAAKKRFTLDTRELLAFSARRPTLPFSVWCTRQVHQEIAERRTALVAESEESRGPLDDVAADVIDVPLLFKVVASGRGALVVNLAPESDLRSVVLDRLSEVLGTTYAKSAPVIVAEIPDSQVAAIVSEVGQLCEVHGLPPVPRSDSFERLLVDTIARGKLRERAAFYASMEDVPVSVVTSLESAQVERLFPHQRAAVQWLLETPCAFLGDDMGLGKTLSVLSYFRALKTTQAFDLLLVVCPNSLVRNWLREVALWFPELHATSISGDKGAKAWTLRMLNSEAAQQDVVIVNYEGVRLPYVTPELKRLVSQRRTLLALDESQRVKNHTAKTFKAMSEIAPSCARRVLLSGTPTPRDVSDLWAQMRLLDGGERFGKSYYRWLEGVAELGTEFSDFAVKKWHEDAVRESILRAQEIMLRRKKEKVVNLPAKTFSLREVELTGSQRQRYEEIREALILRMRTVSGEQFVREITNILEEYLRAVQVASNPRLIDPEWKGEPAKFLELDEIVHELVREQGQKIVVWTNYLGNVRELCERYKDLGAAPFSGEVSAAERERTVRAFQGEDSPRILVAVPAAGGVGITLTAAQTAVYIDKTWNAEHWMQSVDRIHRIGQRGTVNVISLLGCKVDEIIHWNLRRKEQRQAEVLGDTDKRGPVAPTESEGITLEQLMEALELDTLAEARAG
jgi:hypothetical protein